MATITPRYNNKKTNKDYIPCIMCDNTGSGFVVDFLGHEGIEVCENCLKVELISLFSGALVFIKQ
jgi:hypothetical protein